MGSKQVSATFYSFEAIDYFTAYATVTWDSNLKVTISNIWCDGLPSGKFGWRIRGRNPDTQTYAEIYVNDSFYGTENKTYIFQARDLANGDYNNSSVDLSGFTVSSSSSGGSSGGGTGGNVNYTLTYNRNGKNWKTFPNNVTAASMSYITLEGPTPPDDVTGPTSNFIITGNANGGIDNTSLTATKIPRIQYLFDGWNSNADGSGTNRPAGYRFLIDSNTTLYAQQEIVNSPIFSNNKVSNLPIPQPPQTIIRQHTVTFYPDGGNLESEIQKVDTTVNYNFSRWTTDQAGQNEAIELTETGTVYAQWEEEVSNNSITLPFPQKTGYTFLGWSTTSNGQNLMPAGLSVTISGDISYYAIWELKAIGNVYIHDGVMWKRVMIF